ncbi:protein fem-1 homolog CG6966-like [Saccostrea echinata]|uniref:protein fem-1 homolog CG6966-like n=1 Tax=Saccostrea echinata TaxID=191078 RepID=UPI002A7FB084|nr:protein fem-1 homolog CG6966-like [Saccostrea echinata]
MAAEVKSDDFRLKFLMTMKSLLDWSALQKALEKKSKAERHKILTESFHQKEIEMALEIACKQGMIGAVQFLIDKCGIDVEKVKNVCVWSAASGRHSNIVKYLIENHSVDVNLQNDQGMAAIHFACVSGNEHLVEYLVNKGASLTDTDNKNVNCLIKAGVDVNAKNSNDEHILHGTIRQGFNLNESRLHVIDYLVKAGANVNSVNAANIPVVIYAALTFKSCTKTLGYFLKHPQVNMHDKIDAMKYGGAFLISTGNSKRGFKFWTRAVELQEKMKFVEDENNNSAPFHGDFSSYEPTCIEDIHRMKENPVLPIYFMFALLSKLHVKYGYNCIPCLEGLNDVIISLGCYGFFLEVFAFTFLHTFSNNENLLTRPLKLLKTKFRDEKQVTFLHIAIECMDTTQDYHGDEDNQAELVKILIENGEDVNATDNYLCSPVHELATIVHCDNLHLVQEIVDLMVKHGAHLDIRNKLGWSGLNDMIDCGVKVNTAANQTLQCLAAEVIIEKNLDYRSSTPKALWDFIQLHDPEERLDECKIPYACTFYSQERFWFNVEEHVCDI